MNRLLAYLIAVTYVTLCFVSQDAVGQVDRSSSEGQRISDEKISSSVRAFSALKAGREKLVSGQYSVVVIADHASTPKPAESVRDVAFDLRSGYFRQDFRYTDTKDGAGQYINTPTQSLLVTNDEKVLVRYPPGFFPAGMTLRPFDVRLVGVTSLIPLFQIETTFDSYFRGMEPHVKKGTVSATEVGSKTEPLVRLRINPRGKYGQYIVLDTSKDHVPIRFEEWYDLEKAASADSPDSELDVTWKSMSGVWVPERAIFQMNRGNRQSYDANFHWRRVNCDLAPELFQESGLRLAPDASVIDRRGEAPTAKGR